MIPHFTVNGEKCNQCDSDLYINDQVEMYEDLLFCDSVCVMEYLYRDNNIKQVVLTKNMIYREML